MSDGRILIHVHLLIQNVWRILINSKNNRQLDNWIKTKVFLSNNRAVYNFFELIYVNWRYWRYSGCCSCHFVKSSGYLSNHASQSNILLKYPVTEHCLMPFHLDLMCFKLHGYTIHRVIPSTCYGVCLTYRTSFCRI